MSKTMKKVLLFLMLVIIVIVIVFIVQMLLPNNNTTDPDTSDAPTMSASPSVMPSPSMDTSPSPTEPSPSDEGSVITEETEAGTKYIVTAAGGQVTYSLIADSIMFEYSRTNGIDTFMEVSEASAYISITFVEGADAVTLAPSFLDQFVNYTAFEQSGQNFIPGTEVSGQTVSANDGNTQFDAWLVNTQKGVLAVVISYHMTNNATETTETEQLYNVLNTFTIEQ